jgi:hypothetical protein
MKEIEVLEILRVGQKPNHTDFEKDDLVTITVINPYRYLDKYIGKIDMLCNIKLILDTSKSFESCFKEFFYDDIAKIEKYIPEKE